MWNTLVKKVSSGRFVVVAIDRGIKSSRHANYYFQTTNEKKEEKNRYDMERSYFKWYGPMKMTHGMLCTEWQKKNVEIYVLTFFHRAVNVY